MSDIIPITVLCGFLGSGKTTLLRRWRREESLRDAALIVHDLSDFGLDAELLANEEATPLQGLLSGRVAALHGVHARGQLHLSAARALAEIAALQPPLVFAESTGAARPWPLIRALTQDDRFSLRHFIVTVDALNLHRDFNDAASLSPLGPPLLDPALQQAAVVLAEQIAFATIIVLTKTDTIPAFAVKAQLSHLQHIHPRAAIALSAQAGLLHHQLDGVPAPPLAALQRIAVSLGLSDHDSVTASDVDCLAFHDQRPFHPQRLHDACRDHLGTGLYRTKGYLWLASRPAHVLLWQQAGSQISLELTGLWRAELARNPDRKLLPEELAHLRASLESQHPVFGDRHNQLTLIGLPTARNAFAAALQTALCTPREINEWQHGASFPDPWPQSLRKA
jgi:G3E family GTPase